MLSFTGSLFFLRKEIALLNFLVAKLILSSFLWLFGLWHMVHIWFLLTSRGKSGISLFSTCRPSLSWSPSQPSPFPFGGKGLCFDALLGLGKQKQEMVGYFVLINSPFYFFKSHCWTSTAKEPFTTVKHGEQHVFAPPHCCCHFAAVSSDFPSSHGLASEMVQIFI